MLTKMSYSGVSRKKRNNTKPETGSDLTNQSTLSLHAFSVPSGFPAGTPVYSYSLKTGF